MRKVHKQASVAASETDCHCKRVLGIRVYRFCKHTAVNQTERAYLY